MTSSTHKNRFRRSLLRDYGMLLILLALAALFSLLTLKPQSPVGLEAGRLVAQEIIKQHGTAAKVLIVGRDTAEDREFTAAAAASLGKNGATIYGQVNGSASDARFALEKLVETGLSVDAIATNDVTAKWNVYDRFPQIGSAKCVTPRNYLWPDFLKLSNLIGVANQTAIYAIIAVGMTLVIITGGIDLSVGSLVALASVVTALLIRGYGGPAASPLVVAFAVSAAIAVCAGAGVFHGLLVTLGRVPPVVVTLGSMLTARGAARWLSEARSIPELPASFLWLGGGKTLGIPHPIILMVVAYLIAHWLMSRTVFGRYVYAIGGNPEAARLSGVPNRLVLTLTYALCGALAGLGGVILASQLGAGDPKFGNMYELEVIAAVVVGGTSLRGGQGKIFGTLIGAFIIAVISNGMNLLGLDPDLQLVVLGSVLTLAVLLDAATRSERVI
ncbi:MAG: ABC transporter permease [Planctomycetota bacterium]